MSQLNYLNNHLQFDSKAIKELATEYKTPFYLYSENALLNQFNNFNQASKSEGIQDALVCFALKANPNPHLVQSLFKAGAGADIVSGGELQRALQSGCDPMKIVFSGVGKTEQELVFALEASDEGIFSFNVESREELELLNQVAASKNKVARVAFRVNPQVNAKTHKYISTGYKTHKFGILKEDLVEILQGLDTFNNIKLVGLSVHIGSQLTEFSATKKAVQEICDMALTLKSPLEFIDVGGGLGVDYVDRDLSLNLKLYMQTIAEVFNEKFPAKRPRVVFEPGRFISAAAGVFVTRVIRTKTSGTVSFAIVDGGMNDFVRTSLYEAYHKIIPVEVNNTKEAPTEIVGPICETSDSFATKYKIQQLRPNDLIAVLDVGAYGHSMSSTYNLRRRPLEITITPHGEIIKHEY